MKYHKKWSEEKWLLLSWHKHFSHKDFADIGGWWYGTLAWILSVGFDGDNEPGDPSGFDIILCGTQLEIYWPMHYGIMVHWPLGQLPLIRRFAPKKIS